MENIFKLIDKILPMLSTLLGAYITYYVTISSKNNEIKVNSQARARDEYWIPCSVAIENLNVKITELTKDATHLVSFNGVNSCEFETSELLKYLQADKRIYFYERTRNILYLLSESIQYYEKAIDSDVQSLVIDFKKHYYSMLKEFSVYKINNCHDCIISTKKTLPQDIKNALLTNNRMDWMGQVISIYFFKGDTLFKESFSADMSYYYDDFYYDVWYRIRECGERQSNFDLSNEQELGLDILDFEYKNIDKFGDILNQTIATKNYKSKYTKIFETLSLLHETILSNIDETTIL